MHKRLLSVFLFEGFFQMSGLRALQTYPLLDQGQTHLKVSRQEQNRIAVQNDRIQQIFGAEGSFDVQSDESGGQIFVRLLDPAQRHPITLTLITESGLTHDCTLVPEDIPFQSILLKPGESTAFPDKDPKAISSVKHLSSLMRSMISGHPFEGYKLSKLKSPDRSYPAPLKITPHVLYQGSTCEGRHCVLTNSGDTEIPLSEAVLSLPQDKAIVLGKKRLASGESCGFFVVSERRNPV